MGGRKSIATMPTQTTKELKLVIPAPNIQLMKVRIKGTTPIIFNKWSQKAIQMIEEKQQKKATANKKHDTRDPEKEYQGSFYRDAEGYIAFPANCVKQAVVGSSRNIQGLTMTLLRGAVFFMGDGDGYVRLLVKGKPIKASNQLIKEGLPEYETGVMAVDKHNPDIAMRRDMVRLAGFGSPADIRYRGQVSNWEMEFIVKLNADVLSPEQVLNLLQIAGFSSGLGEWRAERNGDSGSFEVQQD